MEWISCSERLPEERKIVLIYVPTMYYLNRQYIDIAWLDDNQNFVGSDYSFDLEDVTHWQPLPKAPELI